MTMFNLKLALRMALICTVAVSSLGGAETAIAQASAQNKAIAEVERQLKSWGKAGRLEDIEIVKAHNGALVKQVKSGKIDLQAILDEHNYKHKDGKFYGQTQPASGAGTASPQTKTVSKPSPGPAISAPINIPMARIAPAQVPAASRPVSADVDLVGRFQGFPAQYTLVAKVSFTFPNGLSTRCAKWDPRKYKPTNDSAGQAVKNCEFEPAKDKGSSLGFTRGETIDVNFGNVNALGYGMDSSTGTATSISNSSLLMTKSGRIAMGSSSGFSIAGAGSGGGGGKTRKPITGRYALDGYLITIVTDEGETHVGFIAWSANKAGTGIGHIHLNGKHYWDRND